jgi:hypothetical protein
MGVVLYIMDDIMVSAPIDCKYSVSDMVKFKDITGMQIAPLEFFVEVDENLQGGVYRVSLKMRDGHERQDVWSERVLTELYADNAVNAIGKNHNV